MEKNKIQVLLVEDNPTDVIFISRALGADTLASYEIRNVEQLDAALSLLQRETFDVILLDMGLPDSQGSDTFTRLHRAFPDIPVVILSGLVDEELALRTVHAGAQDYLVKGSTGFSAAGRAIRYAIERQKLDRSLQESEVRYHQVLDSMIEGCQIIGYDWRYLYTNSAACNQGHYSAQELLGHTMMEMYPGIENTLLFETLRQCMETRTARRFDNQFVYPDGSMGWFELSVQPTGQGLFILSVDITERKLSEEAQLESAVRFRTLFEASPEAIMLIEPDENWTILDCNTAACEMNGYTREELVGQSIDILNLTPGSETERRKYIEEIRKAGILRLESFHRRKDGSVFPIEVSTSMLILGGRQIVLGIDRDITERRQVEERVRAAQAFAQDTIDALSAHICVLDENGIIVSINRAWREFADANPPVTNGYFLGENYLTVCDTACGPDSAEAPIAAQGIRAVMGGGMEHFQLEYPCPSTWEERWFAVKVTKFIQDGFTRIVVAHENITERKKAENALTRNEHILRLFVEHSPAAIAMFDRDMRYIVASHRYLSDYGLEEQDLTGRSHYEVFPEISEHLKEIHTRCLSGAIESADAEPFLRADGHTDWVRWEIRPWYEQEGNIGGIILFSEVITERKQFENQLRDANERFTEIVNNISDIFWVSEPHTRKNLYSSPAFEAVIGQSVDTVSQLPDGFLDVLVPEDRHLLIEAWEHEDAGMRSDVQYRIRRPDGSIRWIRDKGSPVFDENGRVVRVVGIARDLTEQVEAEMRLRESELRLRQMAENIQEAFWMFDRLAHKHVYANPAYEAMFDVTEEILRSDPDVFVKRVVPEDLPAVLSMVEKQQLSECTEIEYRIFHANGAIRWIWDRSFPIHDENGKLIRTAGVATDITERKLAGEQMRQRLVELEMLYASGLVLNQLSSPKKIGEKIIELLEQKMDWHHSAIRLYNPEDGSFRLIAFNHRSLKTGRESQQVDERFKNQVTKPGDGITGWVWQNNQTVRSGNVDTDPRYRASYPGIHSGLYVPMRLGQNAIGVISVESEKPDAFSESDERLVATLSSQAAVAIENALLRGNLERRVRERAAEVQDLYDNAPTGYHSLDINGRFVQVNQTELNWLGYTREEVIGCAARDFMTEESKNTFRENFPGFLQRGWLKDLELEFVRKDGSILPVSLNATALRDEAGNFVMSRSTIFDITERRKAEHALHESEEQNRLLFEESPIPVTLLDEPGHIIRVNRAYEQLVGIPRSNLYGKTSEEVGLVDAQVINSLTTVMLEAVSRQENFAIMEHPLISADGTRRIVESRIFLLPINSVNHILVTTNDISTHKKAEETLRHANVELERAMRMKDEFLATMSHELRTPLTGILGLSEALQMEVYGGLSERQTKTIKTIEDSGRHLLALINDVLDLSKIEAGKLTLEISRCSLGEICQAGLQLTKGMVHQKQQHVTYLGPVTPIFLDVDSRRIKQVIVNLFSNAIKFTPENGELGLTVEPDEANQQVRLVVWDKGIGIKQENLSRLFLPFTQIDGSLAREYSGTGLGLALVRRLVELHNGSIHVESGFGEGSRFIVTLPWKRQKAHGGFPETTGNEEPQPGAVDENKSSPMVLIADDNLALLEMLSDFLETKRYRTAKAQSGRELLEKIESIKPDAILMDIQMPGLNGLETIRRVRGHENADIASTPIIAITALAMTGDRERCLEAGANDYISKPVKLMDLVETLNKLTGGLL